MHCCTLWISNKVSFFCSALCSEVKLRSGHLRGHLKDKLFISSVPINRLPVLFLSEMKMKVVVMCSPLLQSLTQWEKTKMHKWALHSGYSSFKNSFQKMRYTLLYYFSRPLRSILKYSGTIKHTFKVINHSRFSFKVSLEGARELKWIKISGGSKTHWWMKLAFWLVYVNNRLVKRALMSHH